MRGVNLRDAANLQGRLWTPDALKGAGLAGWWDASDLSTITCDASAQASTLKDKSGNANHATPAVAGNRPPFLATGWISSGLPALAPSTTDQMNFTAAISYNATNGMSAMCVCENSSTNTGKSFFASIGAGGGAPEIRWSGSPGTLQLLRTNQALLVSSAASAASSSFHVAGMGAQTNYSAVFLDGTETSNATNPAFSSVIDCLFFSGVGPESFLGLSGETIISTKLWSAAVRQRVEGYLAWKWDGGRAGTLVGQLPASHPYKNAPPLIGDAALRRRRPMVLGATASFSSRYYYDMARTA